MPEKEFKIWLEDGLVLAWRDSGSGGISSFRVVLLAEIDGEVHCVKDERLQTKRRRD